MPEEISKPRYAVRRTRRTYSAQFKAQLVAACLQPGASVAALAREHGMNANVLHRWLKEHRVGMHPCDLDPASSAHVDASCGRDPVHPVIAADHACTSVTRPSAQDGDVTGQRVPAFIAMDLGMSAARIAQPLQSLQSPPASRSSSCDPPDIRIECRHHGTQVTVHWPMTAAAECGHWLKSLLQGTPT